MKIFETPSLNKDSKFSVNSPKLNGVKKPNEPRLNDIIGGMDLSKSELAYSNVPSPPRQIIISIDAVNFRHPWKGINCNDFNKNF